MFMANTMMLLTTILLFLLEVVLSRTSDIIIVTDLAQSKIFTGAIDPLSDLVEIPLQNLSRPTAVDYDPVEDRVYWTDPERRTISRAFLNGSNQEVVVTLSLTSEPEGIAVDIDKRLIYWTDNGTNTIERAQLNGSGREPIVTYNLNKPRAIVVDAMAGHLYWTDWGNNPKIERAKTDGSDRVALVDTYLQWPNGLAIDYTDQKLYWCDAGLDTIESIDLSGGGRSGNLFTQSIPIHPYDIAVYNDNLYWTDWNFAKLVRMNKYAGDASTAGNTRLQQAGGLHIYQKQETTTTAAFLETPPATSSAATPPSISETPPKSTSQTTLETPTGTILETTPGTSLETSPATIIAETPPETTLEKYVGSCSHPGDIKHGTSIPNYPHQDLSPGDKVAYICEETFEHRGAKTIVCLENSTWSDERPTCVPLATKKESKGINFVAVGVIVAVVAAIFAIVIIVWIMIAIRQKKRRNTGPNQQGNSQIMVANDEIYLTPTPKHSYAEPTAVVASGQVNEYMANPTYETISETSGIEQEQQLGRTKDTRLGQTNMVVENGYCAMGSPKKSSLSPAQGCEQSTDMIGVEHLNNYVLPCQNLNQIAIPSDIREKLSLLEKWRDILNNPNVIKHLKPILTEDYLSYFPEMIQADQEEIMSNYRYNSSHKAGAAFIDKLSRMELSAVNHLMEALCENGQHSIHLYLYDMLMAPPPEDHASMLHPVSDLFPIAESPEMSEDEIEEQQSHRKIWMDIVKNYIKDLRTLPYSSIHNKFEAHLEDFLKNFSQELESERRNKGETRAVEWLIREVIITESKWPEALIEVLQAHNKSLLSMIQRDFKTRHENAGCICAERNQQLARGKSEQPTIAEL